MSCVGRRPIWAGLCEIIEPQKSKIRRTEENYIKKVEHALDYSKGMPAPTPKDRLIRRERLSWEKINNTGAEVALLGALTVLRRVQASCCLELL